MSMDQIPMIEKREFDDVVRDRDFARQQWRDWNDKAEELAKTIEIQDASASREIDRLQGNWEAAEKEVQALKLENARLRKALEKYANPETHSMDENGETWYGDYFDYKTARDALEGK